MAHTQWAIILTCHHLVLLSSRLLSSRLLVSLTSLSFSRLLVFLSLVPLYCWFFRLHVFSTLVFSSSCLLVFSSSCLLVFSSSCLLVILSSRHLVISSSCLLVSHHLVSCHLVSRLLSLVISSSRASLSSIDPILFLSYISRTSCILSLVSVNLDSDLSQSCL